MIPPLQYLSSPKTLNGALETWFVQNTLLGGAPVSIFDHLADKSPKLWAPNIVYLELFQIDAKFIRQIHDQSKKVVLIHMGDEFAKKDISTYPECDLILRNYYFPELFSQSELKDRLLWIPNGFKSGVGPRTPQSLQPATHRQHLASFMGWIANPDSFAGERDSFGRMVRAVRKTKGGRLPVFTKWLDRILHRSQERYEFSRSTFECEDLYLLSSNGFASGNNLGLYSAIMENSVFAPCPAGNSPETIRLYDALESGCIPISLDHLFLRSELALAAIGPVPFPILQSWDELPAFLTNMKVALQEQPQRISELQQQCIDWWSAYKEWITNTITKRITAL